MATPRQCVSDSVPKMAGVLGYFDRSPAHNGGVFRRHLIDLLSHEPRSISSLARELGASRSDLEDDLRHAILSARAHGHLVRVIPARCKSCDFVFDEAKLSKPSRCPACRGTRLFEPMLQIDQTQP